MTVVTKLCDSRCITLRGTPATRLAQAMAAGLVVKSIQADVSRVCTENAKLRKQLALQLDLDEIRCHKLGAFRRQRLNDYERLAVHEVNMQTVRRMATTALLFGMILGSGIVIALGLFAIK